MGQAHVARVDVAALIAAARQYDEVASVVEAAARNHLSGLAFDGSRAGRAHVASGDALRLAVEDVADQLRMWSRAAADVAAALRGSADRYRTAESRAAAGLG